MSRILVTRHSNMTAIAVITFLFFMGLLLLPAESRDDPTDLLDYSCVELMVSEEDPYLIAVTNVLGGIAHTAANQPDYEAYISNTEQGITAYAFGGCNPNIVSDSDQCVGCLSTCAGMFLPMCGPAIGAYIELAGCFIRYADYMFW